MDANESTTEIHMPPTSSGNHLPPPANDGAEASVANTCVLCGADVTHAFRHKNRLGQYLCRTCTKKRNRTRLFAKLVANARIAILWLGLALVLGWGFVKVLDFLNRPGDATAGSFGGP